MLMAFAAYLGTQTVPQMSIQELAGAAAAARAESTPSDAAVLQPDAAGMIDLAARAAAASVDRTANPFRLRWIDPATERTVQIRISGVACVGGAPEGACCVINGQTLGIGDAFDGFKVAAIDPSAVDLFHDGWVLRVPTARPVSVRLAR